VAAAAVMVVGQQARRSKATQDHKARTPHFDSFTDVSMELKQVN